MSKIRTFFLLLFAALAASRLCHVRILWEGDALPIAAAGQMLGGHTLYRDIWYDKPPLVPAFYLLSAARPGWALRLEDALFALLCCSILYAFARDLWSKREGIFAAGLAGFYLIFYLPSAVIPVSSDLLMLGPHAAAVWMAYRRRPFWSGALAGLAFWINPKGVFVAAACLLWNPAGALAMACGWAAASAIAVSALAGAGALGAYWREVWQWGRLYASGTFVANPLREGVSRTLAWAGFHCAAVVAAVWCAVQGVRQKGWWAGARWFGWMALCIAGVCMGLRFFPRYYFLLLPPLALMAARGFTLLGRARIWVALLLIIPVVRFAPTYWRALADDNWRDTAMDRDSQAAARLIRGFSRPGETLFVWGYRPEIYTYSGMPAATVYLDSQPLTGVPADRHLAESAPVETVEAGKRRLALAASKPDWLADGLSGYNAALGISHYPELTAWFAQYHEVARTTETVIYARKTEP